MVEVVFKAFAFYQNHCFKKTLLLVSVGLNNNLNGSLSGYLITTSLPEITSI
jgi:hypothetical protein